MVVVDFASYFVFVSEVVSGVLEDVKDRASISPAPALTAWLSWSLDLTQGRDKKFDGSRL